MTPHSEPVIIVAKLQPLPGREAEVEKICRDAVRAVHTEPGCERFALHRLTDGDGALVFVERWASQTAFDEHTRAPAYAALGSGLDGMLAGAPEVLVLQSLPEGDPSLGEL